jgi:hypothetical protein
MRNSLKLGLKITLLFSEVGKWPMLYDKSNRWLLKIFFPNKDIFKIKNDMQRTHLKVPYGYEQRKFDDTPHTPWNGSLKMNTMEEKGVGVHSLIHNTLKVKGHARALGWVLKWMKASQLFTQTYTNQTKSWLVRNWNIFGAWMSHGHTWIHKTHNGPNLREATSFPFVVFYVINHKGYIQMSFCPNLRISKLPKLGFLAFWNAIISCVDLQLKWNLK